MHDRADDEGWYEKYKKAGYSGLVTASNDRDEKVPQWYQSLVLQEPRKHDRGPYVQNRCGIHPTLITSE